MLGKALACAATLWVASVAPAHVSFSVVPVSNPLSPNHRTWDLRAKLSADDDWTSTALTAQIVAAGQANYTFTPRRTNLEPPRTPPFPPPDSDAYANYSSTPNDFPNVGDGRESTYLRAGTSTALGTFLHATWFDTGRNLGVEFTVFRLTILKDLGAEELTLAKTGFPAANVRTTTSLMSTQGSLVAYDFTVYRVPEPSTLGLIALGGLAGLLRRR